MQLVQTLMRLLPPFTFARTGRRFTSQRRRVLLLAWETLLPNCGPLPHRSHLAAMVMLQSLARTAEDADGRFRLRSAAEGFQRTLRAHSSALWIIPCGPYPFMCAPHMNAAPKTDSHVTADIAPGSRLSCRCCP